MRRAHPTSKTIFSKERGKEQIDLVAQMGTHIPPRPELPLTPDPPEFHLTSAERATTFELLQRILDDTCICGGKIHADPVVPSTAVFCRGCHRRLKHAGMTYEEERAMAEFRMTSKGRDMTLASYDRCADYLHTTRPR